MRPPEFDRELTNAMYRVNNWSYRLTRYTQENKDNVVINEEERQDIIQDTFLFAMEHYYKYKPETNMSAWLIGICLNVIRWHRKEIEHKNSVPYFSYAMPAYQLNNYDYRLMCKLVDEGIAALNPIRRRYIEHFMAGHKVIEIAREEKVTNGKVKSFLYYSRKRIAQKLVTVFERSDIFLPCRVNDLENLYGLS